MARTARSRWRLFAITAALAVAAAACSVGDGDEFGSDGEIPEGCAAVEVASSPEKVELLTELANQFNDSDAAREGGCAFVRVTRGSSGATATLMSQNWPDPETNGPQPVIWSPAASSWGAVVNQRLTDAGLEPTVPSSFKSFMVTPLVIAMPRRMATAIGWPQTPIGFADLIELVQNPEGWAAKGHPEWGQVKLGKTNPNFSTSALSATIAQYYAATGKVRDLTLEDVNKPDVDTFNRAVESAVVHYGDTTLTFLNNWYRNDARGTALTYVSAVAIEEKSVIDYNRGNPDGITDPGEQPRPPREPLVAIYPKDGTLLSDNPLFIVDAPWVSAEQKRGAQAFVDFVLQPENQRQVLRYGFRPGNPQVALGAPINEANGVDPDQPQTTLGVPEPAVLVRLIERWGEQRKGAKVMLVVDVSGSMGEEAAPGVTKLDLAKQAAIDALRQFKADDLVALRIFSTNIGPADHLDYADLVGFGPIGQQRERIESRLRDLIPTEGTPLFTVAGASFNDVKREYDPKLINAVVLLTDGRNEDPNNNDLDGLIRTLRASSEGVSSTPVRVFTIGYGADADLGVLRRIAETTNAAAYDASDPQTINRVFTAVISNF